MKRMFLPTLLVAGTLAAAAFSGPIAQAVKAFSAGKAGEIHGVIAVPTTQGAQGLVVYLPGRNFMTRLAKSGEFTLNYVPPGNHTLVVATVGGQVLHSESAVAVDMHGITELGTITLTPDSDGDGFTIDQDCDDLNAAVYPGAPEIEDGVDNNCDGLVDEGFNAWTDADSDGYPAQSGWAMPVDCDDSLASVHPGAVEVCDGLDNDCDGYVDEGFDLDGDGYTSCDGDCDDGDPTIHPGSLDNTPDGIDNDCDGLVDEDFDSDGDGYTPVGGDCDDSNPSTYPGAEDILDYVDNDCDGQIDEDAFHFVNIKMSSDVYGGDVVPFYFENLPAGATLEFKFSLFDAWNTQVGTALGETVTLTGNQANVLVPSCAVLGSVEGYVQISARGDVLGGFPYGELIDGQYDLASWIWFCP